MHHGCYRSADAVCSFQRAVRAAGPFPLAFNALERFFSGAWRDKEVSKMDLDLPPPAERCDQKLISGILEALKFHDPRFRRAIRTKIITSAMSRAAKGATDDAAYLFSVAAKIEVDGPVAGTT